LSSRLDQFLADRCAEALNQLKALRRPLPEGFQFDRDKANEEQVKA
jgi:hypothetical protein